MRREFIRVQKTGLGQQTFYDAMGNAIANRDVAGNYSYKLYDKLGRVTYEVDTRGYVTGYESMMRLVKSAS